MNKCREMLMRHCERSEAIQRRCFAKAEATARQLDCFVATVRCVGIAAARSNWCAACGASNQFSPSQ